MFGLFHSVVALQWVNPVVVRRWGMWPRLSECWPNALPLYFNPTLLNSSVETSISIRGQMPTTSVLFQADMTQLVANASWGKRGHTRNASQLCLLVVTLKCGYRLRPHLTSLTQVVWQDAIWRLSERNLSAVVRVWHKYYRSNSFFSSETKC